MLRQLLGDTLHLQGERPCAYACPCSRERMARNLIAMGREELAQLAEDANGIDLQCHFCSARYQFSQDEISKLLTIAQTKR